MTNIQQSYREAAVRGASPVGLVVRLYEQMIEDLRQVDIAIEQNDIQRRSNRIKHAILVLGHLQSSLDFAHGGKVAENLDNFYNVLRQNLLQVQFFPSKRALAQQITDLRVLREAWVKVEQAEKPSGPASAIKATLPRFSSTASEPQSDRVHLDWQG